MIILEEEFEVEIQSINWNRFLIQIVVAISIALLMQFLIFPHVIMPFLNLYYSQFMEFSQVPISSLSMWFFAFSCVYFIYPDNKFINNYIFCSFFPLMFIVSMEWMGLFFWDFFHLLPIIINFYILAKKSRLIRLSQVAIIQAFLILWFVLVQTFGLNYQTVVVDAFYLLIWYAIIVFLASFVRFLVLYYDTKEN